MKARATAAWWARNESCERRPFLESARNFLQLCDMFAQRGIYCAVMWRLTVRLSVWLPHSCRKYWIYHQAVNAVWYNALSFFSHQLPRSNSPPGKFLWGQGYSQHVPNTHVVGNIAYTVRPYMSLRNDAGQGHSYHWTLIGSYIWTI